MDVRLPDGRILRGVPDGTTKEQIAQKLGMSAPQNPQSLGKTVLDQSLQGATFGFADEITDRIGAGIATAAGAGNYDELLKQARSSTKADLAAQMEQHPVPSIAANIAGGLLTGGAAGTTKAGAVVGNSIRGGNLGARVAKGVAAGAASGGLYGAGTGEEGTRLERAASGAALGGLVGGALPLAGAGFNKLNTKTFIPNSGQVREAGSKSYKLAEQKGGALNEAVANKFYNQVLRIRPQTLEGRVFSGESPVTKIYDKIPELMNRPMTLRAAMEIDEALGDLAYSTMDTFGKISKDGKRFLDMQGALRRTIEEADDTMVIGGKEGFNALKDARKYWSTSLKMRDIERIIERAKNREQPVTAIKTGFSNLLNRGDKLKGYSPAEVKAIQKAAKTGVVTDIIRLAGSGLVPIGSSIAGTAGGGIPGGMIGAATGSALQQTAKAAGTAIQTGRANEALKEVAKRSGLVQETKRLKLPPEMLKKIAAMPPKAARALLDQLSAQP